MKRLQRGDNKMNDYYSIYTWAMDKQAAIERQAEQRRLLRQSKPLTLLLRWPVEIRREDPVEIREEERDAVA
ncbi:MAG TPA: hypothetical protein VN973_11275 [Candidatus Dormibacteraeota bacterium]|nr:hypothetical protein [Candidatus Dormibacteraeota bacterium]